MLMTLLIVVAILAALIVLAVRHMRSLFKKPDYADLPGYYPFKSETVRDRYLAYYDGRAGEWPVSSEARFVDTAYGRTFVRSCGREDGTPLMLLPSGFASSLIWLPNMEGLSPHFRIHAVDNIYDVGRSVNTRPVTNADDLTEWLDELIGKLEPGKRVNLMGLSFGGWLAGQYALRRPERLRKVVLAAPAATIFPLPAAWAWRAILGALPPHKFFMTRFLVNWMCRGLAEKGDESSRRMLSHWMNDALMAMKCFRFRMPINPTVLTDGELRGLKVPTLFIVGEYEVVYPAQKAVDRIKTLAPGVETEVIPHAGHDLTIAQTDAFNARVVAFLQATVPGLFQD